MGLILPPLSLGVPVARKKTADPVEVEEEPPFVADEEPEDEEVEPDEEAELDEEVIAETVIEELDEEVEDIDTDEEEAEVDETLDDLEAEELALLEDEVSETILVDEVAELRAIRREELTMDIDAHAVREDEFVCQSCFLVKRTSQLANRRKMICRDCAS